MVYVNADGQAQVPQADFSAYHTPVNAGPPSPGQPTVPGWPVYVSQFPAPSQPVLVTVEERPTEQGAAQTAAKVNSDDADGCTGAAGRYFVGGLTLGLFLNLIGLFIALAIGLSDNGRNQTNALCSGAIIGMIIDIIIFVVIRVSS